ncbi:MAG: hypothetical protein LBU32_11345 [Clostridiales bacterium]|jgi:uroporphyrinogen decarboxylase|nr:hypothetical protein [Clostridiales bacterium]
MCETERNLRFLPTIFEHAAFLIGRTPSEASLNSELMKKAHVEAHCLYRPDSVTVGIDVYNIEAEALGCKVSFFKDSSVPGIADHPLDLDGDPKKLEYSRTLGRIQLVIESAAAVKKDLEGDSDVSVGVCGPFSILMELAGYERAVEMMADEESKAKAFLDALALFQIKYCSDILAKGLGVVVFESWASPPLVSPEIYRIFGLPPEKRLLKFLRQSGLKSRPLVIGGDTSAILDDMLGSGATLVVSDYSAPLPLFARKAKKRGLKLRANIDPRLIHKGEGFEGRINEIKEHAEGFPDLIAGTGVIPYDTPPENLLIAKKMLARNAYGL